MKSVDRKSEKYTTAKTKKHAPLCLAKRGYSAVRRSRRLNVGGSGARRFDLSASVAVLVKSLFQGGLGEKDGYDKRNELQKHNRTVDCADDIVAFANDE